MWIKLLCFLAVVITSESFNLASNPDYLKLQIDQSIKPHQIIIFESDTIGVRDTSIYKSISSRPKVLIDYFEIENCGDNDSLLKLPVLHNPRSSSLYIITANENCMDKFLFNAQKLLKLFVHLSPIQPRPKCLVLYYGNNESPKNLFHELLFHAWKLKFLDFSILIINASKTFILTYNPFLAMYHQEDYDINTVIFPQKLKNMNQYPFKTQLFHFPPSIIMPSESITAINSDVQITGYDYPYFEIFSKTVNCSLDFLFDYVGVQDVTKVGIFKDSEFNKVNTYMVSCAVATLLYPINVTFSIPFRTSKFSFFVPVIKRPVIKIPANIFTNLSLLFISIAICIGIIYKFQKSSLIELKVSFVFKSLLGVALSTIPYKKSVDRLIYLVIVVLSINYWTEIISKLILIQFSEDTEPLNTIKEIDDYGLQLMVPSPLIKSVSGIQDETVQKLLTNAKFVNGYSDCIREVINTNKYFCISLVFFSDYLLDHKRGELSYDSRKIKSAESTFMTDTAAFPFEKASPYVERFNEILQRLVESGIEKSAHRQWGKAEYLNFQNVSRSNEDTEREFESINIVPGLLVILIGGCLISGILFIIELGISYIKKRVYIKISEVLTAVLDLAYNFSFDERY